MSTSHQDINNQIDDLQKFGCKKIFQEVVSGGKAERVELNKLFAILREGDTLVVTRLDRLGRSTKDLISIMDKLASLKVDFICIQQNINTTTIEGKLLFHLIAVMAEFERDIIRARVKDGLEKARARGRIGGRPKGIAQKNMDKATYALYLYQNKENTITECLKKSGIKSKATFYKYVRFALSNLQ